MRMPFLTGLLIAAAVTATAGCASAGSGASTTAANSRASSPGRSPTSSPTSSPRCTLPTGVPPDRAAGEHVFTLTSAQAGKTYCVKVGTSVLVFLRGTPSDKWRPIQASGSALRPSASGRMTLMLGVTGASFLAARPGTSVISSARPACASSATPADVPCDAAGMFRVTVIVQAG